MRMGVKLSGLFTLATTESAATRSPACRAVSASGTDDKAGSALNLLRFVAPRTIKETFVPATDYRYSFLKEP